MKISNYNLLFIQVRLYNSNLTTFKYLSILVVQTEIRVHLVDLDSKRKISTDSSNGAGCYHIRTMIFCNRVFHKTIQGEGAKFSWCLFHSCPHTKRNKVHQKVIEQIILDSMQIAD